MIFIARLPEQTIESACGRRGITILKMEVQPDSAIAVECPEADRAKVRDWFARDDSVLWFSSI